MLSDAAPPVDAPFDMSVSQSMYAVGFLDFVEYYVGTAVSRLRRPCLSLRLLL